MTACCRRPNCPAVAASRSRATNIAHGWRRPSRRQDRNHDGFLDAARTGNAAAVGSLVHRSWPPREPTLVMVRTFQRRGLPCASARPAGCPCPPSPRRPARHLRARAGRVQPAGAAGAIPRAHPGQWPAGDQRRGPRQPDRRGPGLVPRRLQGRPAGTLRLRAPVRAPDVQGHRAHARRADGPPHRGRRRQQQRLHRRRHHQLLRGRPQQLPADPAVGRGRAPVQPQGRRQELQVRARGGAGGIPAAGTRRSVRQAVQRDRSALLRRASVQATDHRQHRGSRRRFAAGRDRFPQDVLSSRQRDPDRHRRLRSEAARCLGRPVFRLDPEARVRHPAGRPDRTGAQPGQAIHRDQRDRAAAGGWR